MKKYYAFLLVVLLSLFFCDNANNKKSDLINQENIYVKIDGQEANFFPATSKLRFSDYGDYQISDVFLMNNDKEPPLRVFLPRECGGYIEIINKGQGNDLAVIDFDSKVSTRILNSSWKKMLLKGVENDGQNYCTVYLEIGRN